MLKHTKKREINTQKIQLPHSSVCTPRLRLRVHIRVVATGVAMKTKYRYYKPKLLYIKLFRSCANYLWNLCSEDRIFVTTFTAVFGHS